MRSPWFVLHLYIDAYLIRYQAYSIVLGFQTGHYQAIPLDKLSLGAVYEEACQVVKGLRGNLDFSNYLKKIASGARVEIERNS